MTWEVTVPECHRCQYDGKGDPHCLTCKGPPATNNKGRYVVSRDSGGGHRSEAEVASDTKRISVARTYNPAKELDYALEVIYAFVELTQVEFDLVRQLVGGATQSDIARAHGLTRQAISLAMRKLVKKHPVFGVLRSHALTRRTMTGVGMAESATHKNGTGK